MAMTKKIWFNFLISSLVCLSGAFAQIHNPVSWEFKYKYLGKNSYEFIYIAKIAPTWHMYSQHLPNGDGPVPTRFALSESKSYKSMTKVLEPKPHTEYDPNFDMQLSYFEGTVSFSQKIEIFENTTIKGEVEYMVCDASKCLPPEIVPFEHSLTFDKNISTQKKSDSINIKQKQENADTAIEPNGILNPVQWNFTIDNRLGKSVFVAKAKIENGWHMYSQNLESTEGPVPTSFSFDTVSNRIVGIPEEVGNKITEYDSSFAMNLSWYESEVHFEVPFSPKSTLFKGSVTYMVCDNEKCLPPEPVEFSLTVPQEFIVAETPVKKTEEEKSIWGILIAGFLGGFVALLTPCVFPMIPMTVSFFTKQSKTRQKGIFNAIIYGLSIVMIYVLMGFGITMIFGADALNALSTNVWFNLFFFILLVVFAISFFGAFEITLPSSWVNKADSASDKGGILGIFFMAFTLSLVSFSCTGPIIGTLLVEAAVHGGVAGPITGMIGFSLALALPFGLFAAFPGYLNSLPQSGGWLNSVKVTLGFIELALAMKFLSNADLVIQAGILKRELFIAIWIGIFLLLTVYLLGMFKLPHDSEIKHVSVPRLIFATMSFIFTIYLIPGLWGAPLKIISGFPPPMFYSESPNGVGGVVSKVAAGASTSHSIPDGADPEHCPHNLNCFHDYELGLAYAKKVNKPIMLDFTGWACVNCRKMEEQVWSDPRVLERLRNDVVLVSLYVDEKLALPENEQKEVEIGGKKKKLKTVGNKWSYLQAVKFNTNSQPFYIFVDHQGNPITESAAYDPDIEKFIGWLDNGTQKFNNLK